MVGQNSSRGSLGFQSAVVASLVLSVVSFLTTWSGLRAADPIQNRIIGGDTTQDISFWEGVESLAITVGLAFGIQALMLALAWIASRLVMVEDRKRYALITSIFVGYFAATSISVTFSYVDLFDRMFSSQKESWSSETIRERGDVIVESLMEELNDDARNARSEFSSLQAEFQAQLNMLESVSIRQQQAILLELDDRNRELSEYRDQVGSERAAARSAAVNLDTRVGELEANVNQLAQKVEELRTVQSQAQTEVDDYTAQSRAKEDEKLLEERGAQESAASGRGPVWRRLDREHDIIKAKLEVAQNRLDRVSGELQTTQQALLNSRQQLAIAQSSENSAEVDAALNAGSDVRIGFLESEISALTAQADALELPVIDLSGSRFTEAQIDQIENACTQIKSELIAARTVSTGQAAEAIASFDPNRIDCTSGGAFDQARKLFAMQDSIQQLETQCRATSNETYATLGGGELIDYIRNNCINASALSATQKANFLEDLRRVSRTRDPDAAPIAYAFVALQDRETQAIFAFCLALAADLLILIVSLFGNAGHQHLEGPPRAALPEPRRSDRREPALFDDDDDLDLDLDLPKDSDRI